MKRISSMTNKEYLDYIDSISPKSAHGKHIIAAFLVGGTICTIGQMVLNFYLSLGMDEQSAANAECITMVTLGALLTGLGVYDKIAVFAGAGTLVPITGFANAVVSPALEFKTEGYITGTAAKMFTIAGPVIVFGMSTSVIYGILYWLKQFVF